MCFTYAAHLTRELTIAALAYTYTAVITVAHLRRHIIAYAQRHKHTHAHMSAHTSKCVAHSLTSISTLRVAHAMLQVARTTQQIAQICAFPPACCGCTHMCAHTCVHIHNLINVAARVHITKEASARANNSHQVSCVSKSKHSLRAQPPLGDHKAQMIQTRSARKSHIK